MNLSNRCDWPGSFRGTRANVAQQQRAIVLYVGTLIVRGESKIQ
jgi:hypothetical protein